ncbi:hypothetical protein [Streptomyces sp. NPDC051016]|uniref:hypothetical protein n=1 Tax=Streptomyces sp. NPDC051016 TaxID=3365638 RepID=UPI0037AD813F
MATTTDPRVRQLAEAAHRVAREKATKLPEWKDLPLSEREKATAEARLWLRAAVEAGIAPLAERPTDKHMAVYLDEQGFLYGEYDGDDILRLRWVTEQAQSKREMEEQGAEFRLIGWSE